MSQPLCKNCGKRWGQHGGEWCTPGDFKGTKYEPADSGNVVQKRILSEAAAREDLTSRECAKLLGGLIGALTQMAPPEAVRDAMRFWVETEECWTALQQNRGQG